MHDPEAATAFTSYAARHHHQLQQQQRQQQQAATTTVSISPPRYGWQASSMHPPQARGRSKASPASAWARVSAAEVAKNWQASLRPSSPDPRGHRARSLSPPRSPSSPRGPDGGAWGRHAPFNSLETSDGADTTHPEHFRSPLRSSSRRGVDLGGGPGVLGGSGAGNNKPQEPQHQQPSSATAGSTAALQRLGRLRARAEAAFKKLMVQLPRRLDPAPPPPAYKPLTPAFDLGTLRRQVATLQEEVLARHQHQEELFAQNTKLWAAVKAACDPSDWRAAHAEMARLNAEIEGMHAAVVALRKEAALAQGVRSRLVAARGEKERARATLKGAQQAEREAQLLLQQALQENAALEAELAQQTASLQELHAYVGRGREAQQEEDMEELEALAAQVHASSHRRMRRAFDLFREAVRRSQRLRAIATRMQRASDTALLRRCLAAFARHVRASALAARIERRLAPLRLRAGWAALRAHAQQQRRARALGRNALLRRTLGTWRAAVEEARAVAAMEAKRRKLEERRALAAWFKGWRAAAERARAARRGEMAKAEAHWAQRCVRRWRGRVQERRDGRAAAAEELEGKRQLRALDRGLRTWRLLVRMRRFSRARQTAAATTAAACLLRLHDHARRRREARALVERAEARWQRRGRAWAVMALKGHAKQRRQRRLEAARATKAGMVLAARRALVRWCLRTDALRRRRVLGEKGLLTRRRRVLRASIRRWRAWAGAAVGERRRRRRRRLLARGLGDGRCVETGVRDRHQVGSRLGRLARAWDVWRRRAVGRRRAREAGQEAEVMARLRRERRVRAALRRWRQRAGRGRWVRVRARRWERGQRQTRLRLAFAQWRRALARQAREAERAAAAARRREGGLAVLAEIEALASRVNAARGEKGMGGLARVMDGELRAVERREHNEAAAAVRRRGIVTNVQRLQAREGALRELAAVSPVSPLPQHRQRQQQQQRLGWALEEEMGAADFPAALASSSSSPQTKRTRMANGGAASSSIGPFAVPVPPPPPPPEARNPFRRTRWVETPIEETAATKTALFGTASVPMSTRSPRAFADAAGDAIEDGSGSSPPDLMLATAAAATGRSVAAGAASSSSSALYATAMQGGEGSLGGQEDSNEPARELYVDLHESIGRLQARILEKIGGAGHTTLGGSSGAVFGDAMEASGTQGADFV